MIIYIKRSFHNGLSKSTVKMENYNTANIGKKEKHQKKKWTLNKSRWCDNMKV